MIACGVTFDSQIKLARTPFQVDFNSIQRSDSAEKPAGPTSMRCFTCSGCYTHQKKEEKWKMRVMS